jgi:hypothetical protein
MGVSDLTFVINSPLTSTPRLSSSGESAPNDWQRRDKYAVDQSCIRLMEREAWSLDTRLCTRMCGAYDASATGSSASESLCDMRPLALRMVGPHPKYRRQHVSAFWNSLTLRSPYLTTAWQTRLHRGLTECALLPSFLRATDTARRARVTRKTDLHPKIIDMLNAPPALSATAQSAVTSITTLPAVNRKPRAKPQPK